MHVLALLAPALQTALATVAREVLGDAATELLPVVEDDYIWACIAATAPVSTRWVGRPPLIHLS